MQIRELQILFNSEKIIGIYKITSPSGKVYIGSSKNITQRKKTYSQNGCIKQTKLYSSFLKYGFINHTFEIVEICSLEKLLERELYFGLKFQVLDKNGLNCMLPKIDESLYTISNDTRLKMSVAKKGLQLRKGIKHTDESKMKMSISKKGKPSKLKGIKTNFINALSKIVLDFSTGIYYMSAKEASLALNIKHSTLKYWLNEKYPSRNKTNLKYV